MCYELPQNCGFGDFSLLFKRFISYAKLNLVLFLIHVRNRQFLPILLYLLLFDFTYRRFFYKTNYIKEQLLKLYIKL